MATLRKRDILYETLTAKKQAKITRYAIHKLLPLYSHAHSIQQVYLFSIAIEREGVTLQFMLKITMPEDQGLRHTVYDLNAYRFSFASIHCFIIEKIGMMGSKKVVEVDPRSRQLNVVSQPFAGIDVALCRDLRHLLLASAEI